ncbi:hypothetical protein [Cohnella soli]|uniref:Transcriptional regulator n=1 Tax=Cohnella soli TaxID=425005 RepID=A0ABW0HVW3_9BACL
MKKLVNGNLGGNWEGKSEGQQAYEKLLEQQKKTASGTRLEQLNKQGEGERKLLVDILWPVRGSFEGIVLEKEFITMTGAKAYIDAYDSHCRFGLESEGFVVHAENITRPRHDFEKMRIRSMAGIGILYVPLTYDEMDKKPDFCRRSLYELYGKLVGSTSTAKVPPQLSVYEREVIRHAMRLAKPIHLSDVSECLDVREDTSRKIIRSLVSKGIFRPSQDGKQRIHSYELVDPAAMFRGW